MAEKRKPGRPFKNAPAAKKVKTATPKEQTPVIDIEIAEPEREATPLPNRVVDSKPLPTLSARQPLDLPNGEYQSIGASGVLAASLERSRTKWVSGSFFDKYWTKVSTRKDAPPPPPNNPQRSWMKEIGTCTITIEPLIIDATIFYVKEPGMAGPVAQYQSPQQRQPQVQNRPPPPPPPKSAPSPAPSPYGTPYRPQPVKQSPAPHNNFYQGRPAPSPAHAPQVGGDPRHLPPIMPAHPTHQQVAPRPPAPPSAPAPAPAQPAKPSPDPVIQMLATRASTDLELKSLMKIVATGNANQDQLRIFQRHIDELTAIINRNKAQQAQQTPQPPHMHSTPSHYGSNVPSRTSTPGVPAQPQLLPRPGPVATPPPQPQRHANQYTAGQSQHKAQPAHPPPQKYYPPAQQPRLPIVLEFQGPGASPDRFKFPEYSILEYLTPHMLLASFLVIRKGTTVIPAPSTTGATPPIKPEEPKSTDIYEPITLKITVEEGQKGRDMLAFIQRSVRPAAETRTWMVEQMTRCTRAERRHLALRLPHKTQIRETETDGAASKEATPVIEKAKRPAAKKNGELKGKEGELEKEKEKSKDGAAATTTATAPQEPETATTAGAAQTTDGKAGTGPQEVAVGEGVAKEGATNEATKESDAAAPAVGRRSSRRVRGSDVQMTDA